MKPLIEIRPLAEIPGLSRREIESAAWRAIVKEHLGDDATVLYNEKGAPVLDNGRGYIGVSHTKGWVAVVFSPEPCAIDIELKTRRISPAAAVRFSISSIADWCRLEVMYKYACVAGEEPVFAANDPFLTGDNLHGPTSMQKNSPEVRFIPHSELVVAVII